MKYFKLPDLGEGLQEAEIVEWHIKAGDDVAEDQLVLSVETAKAIVELPAPQAGQVKAIFGEPGDLIHVGAPLLEYANAENDDSGTVVGEVETAAQNSTAEDDDFIIGSTHERRPRSTIPRAGLRPEKGSKTPLDHATPLRGVQRSMAINMAKAHAEVVPVTIHDDVDIEHWEKGTDITMRLVKAIAAGCLSEPGLNAWYDGDNLAVRLLDHIDLGIAVDTPDGLFVPVLRDISGRKQSDLRKGLDRLREAVKARKIPPEEMAGATITLSNFGTIAGRYANPVIVPPAVAIMGAGRIRWDLVMTDKGPASHRMLPLSLTFDHRVIRGGEAARFLGAVMQALSGAT